MIEIQGNFFHPDSIGWINPIRKTFTIAIHDKNLYLIKNFKMDSESEYYDTLNNIKTVIYEKRRQESAIKDF